MYHHVFKYVIPENMLTQTINKYKRMNLVPILDYAVEHCVNSDESVQNMSKKIELLNTFPNECHSLKLSSVAFSQDCFESVLNKVKEKNCVLMVDAEEHVAQKRIELLTHGMAAKHDKHMFTTYQMYKVDAFSQLLRDVEAYTRSGMIHNIKLVRGAYLLNDRNLNVLHRSKKDTDEAYNEATKLLLKLCEDNDKMNVVFATHNEQSIDLLRHSRLTNISHAFLMGMERDTFFANKGINKMIHIPFGPLHKTLPYMLRRLLENNPYLDYVLSTKDLKRIKST